MSDVAPRQFALYAYSGGCLWVTAFLTLGYFLGNRWEAASKQVERYGLYLMIACVVAAAGYLLWRRRIRKKA